MKTKLTPRRRYFWVVFLVLLIGLPPLSYYGYCWGLWGRGSLLLQYLFQCKCPAASEQARYPKQVEVLISACKNVSTTLSPSGRLLAVYEDETVHLLDLQNNENIPLHLPEKSGIQFLTDDLLFISSYGGDEYIYDRTFNVKYPIRSFMSLEPKAYSYGEVNTELLFKALLRIEKVYLIDNAYPPVIALSSDFRIHPEHSFTFHYSALPGDNADLVEQFVDQNNIAFYHIPSAFPDEAISPDGRFVARLEGIYLVETNQKIVTSNFVDAFGLHYLSVRGWAYDGTGVIYSAFSNPCLIDLGVDFGCYYEVPQPVVKLKLPEKYLSSQTTP